MIRLADNLNDYKIADSVILVDVNQLGSTKFYIKEYTITLMAKLSATQSPCYDGC